jgi:hypothetical protein
VKVLLEAGANKEIKDLVGRIFIQTHEMWLSVTHLHATQQRSDFLQLYCCEGEAKQFLLSFFSFSNTQYHVCSMATHC